MLKKVLVAAAVAACSMQVSAFELCGSVQGARILEPGRYQISILVDREMEISNYYFSDYQQGGVPNECLSKTALGTRICYDSDSSNGENVIYNCRFNR